MLKIVIVAIHLLILCVIAENAQAKTKNNGPVVEINTGRVQGYEGLSRDGKLFYGFQGIPYAKPPIDSLRFKEPQPAEKWNGIYDGTREGNMCMQYAYNKEIHGDENCLFLNVYTPQLENEAEELFPVMFWIHGGGFLVGTGGHSNFPPQNFLDYPIVFVTINYRLGVFGFLSTEDENAVGNYGMLDQVMALKWVQDNIVSFGGDPNKVTIFGCSAGSAAVVLLMLSPLSSGLFHKAIAQSGSATNHWALQRNPRDWAKGFAKHLQCPNSDDTKSVIKCISEKSSADIIKEDALYRNPFAQFFPNDIAPTIDGKFLIGEPLKLLKEGTIANKVPVIMGMTSTEGYSLYSEMTPKFKLSGRRYFDEEFPFHLATYSPIKPNMTSAHKAIAEEYYNNVNLEDKELFHHIGALINGDATFHADIALTVEHLSLAGLPTYAYLLDYITEHCVAAWFGGKCGKYCSHGDDLFLQFPILNLRSSLPGDIKMGDILNRLFISFALDKDMNVNENEKWPLYDNHRRYVELTLTPKIKKGLLSEKMVFWTETLPNLIRKEKVKDEL